MIFCLTLSIENILLRIIITVMKTDVFTRLRREQLDRQLSLVRRAGLQRPRRGWVRAIREAIGMNGRQLAERMGITRSHVSQVESSEVRGAASLKTLERAASAMGCQLVYAIVPKGGTFEELVQGRAQAVAKGLVESVAHSMALEGDDTGSQYRKKQINQVAAELVRTMSKDLWDTPGEDH